MSIPDTVGEHDITKGNAHFLSSLKYRGQLYSKVYGQATPSTIGQMTSALTIQPKFNDNFYDDIEDLIRFIRAGGREE